VLQVPVQHFFFEEHLDTGFVKAREATWVYIPMPVVLIQDFDSTFDEAGIHAVGLHSLNTTLITLLEENRQWRKLGIISSNRT
jgi:hypothetical protein